MGAMDRLYEMLRDRLRALRDTEGFSEKLLEISGIGWAREKRDALLRMLAFLGQRSTNRPLLSDIWCNQCSSRAIRINDCIHSTLELCQ